MTKDIKIDLNDSEEARYWDGVGRIRLRDADSLPSDWIPEESLKTNWLTVYDDGEWIAEDEGLYGYTQVNVNKEFHSGGTTDAGFNYSVWFDEDGKPHVTVTTEGVNSG